MRVADPVPLKAHSDHYRLRQKLQEPESLPRWTFRQLRRSTAYVRGHHGESAEHMRSWSKTSEQPDPLDKSSTLRIRLRKATQWRSRRERHPATSEQVRTHRF